MRKLWGSELYKYCIYQKQWYSDFVLYGSDLYKYCIYHIPKQKLFISILFARFGAVQKKHIYQNRHSWCLSTFSGSELYNAHIPKLLEEQIKNMSMVRSYTTRIYQNARRRQNVLHSGSEQYKKHIYQKPKIKKKIDIKKSAHCTDFFISSYRR